jgi:hypothetical protein
MMKLPLVAAILRYASTLRFRQLFFLTAGLLVLDLLVPDLLPFVDELLLGLLTLLFGIWRKSKRDNNSRKLPNNANFRDEADVISEKHHHR